MSHKAPSKSVTRLYRFTFPTLDVPNNRTMHGFQLCGKLGLLELVEAERSLPITRSEFAQACEFMWEKVAATDTTVEHYLFHTVIVL